MCQKDYFLKLPLKIKEIENIVRYLQSDADYDVDYQNSFLVFQPQKDKSFLKIFKIADGTGTVDAAIEEISQAYSGLQDVEASEVCREAVAEIKSFCREALNENNFSKLCLFIDTYKSLIFSYQELVPYLLKHELIPLFFKLFPKGEICAIRKSILLEKRFATLRSLHLLEHETFMEMLGRGTQFPGFQTLAHLHMPSIYELEDYLKPILLFFQNHIYGFMCSTGINYPLSLSKHSSVKDEFSLFFLFGENIEWLPKAANLLKGYQIKSSDGPPLKEGRVYVPKCYPWGLESCFKPSFHLFKEFPNIDSIDFTTDQYFKLVEWWVDKLNNLFNYLLNPSNFSEENHIKAERQFGVALTIDRIFKEATLIQSEMRQKYNSPPFAAFNLSFAVLDKIANLMTLIEKQRSDTDNFKSLFKKSKINPKLKEVFDELPVPFNNYFRNQFKEMFERLESMIKDSIFLNIFTTSTKSKIKIGKDDMFFTDYIPELLRTIRNSHHGYLFDNKAKFENVRFYTGRDLIYKFPEIIKFYIMWVLAKIDYLEL